MKRALFYILILTAAGVIAGFIVVFLVLPSMNWSATRTPGRVESTFASYTMSNWIRRNADTQRNPFRPTSENLKAGREDFDEHCPAATDLPGKASEEMDPRIASRH